MGNQPKGDLHCVYDPKRDVMLVHVPHAITQQQLQLVAAQARKIDHGQWLCLNPGDRKDIFAKKIKCWDSGRYCVVLPGSKGKEMVLFKSTQRTGSIISLPGNRLIH